MHNPYCADIPAKGVFVGRTELITMLEDGQRIGNRPIAAVMGGRGMGKTTVLAALRDRLKSEHRVVHIPRPSKAADAVFSEIAVQLDDPTSNWRFPVRQLTERV